MKKVQSRHVTITCSYGTIIEHESFLMGQQLKMGHNLMNGLITGLAGGNYTLTLGPWREIEVSNE